MRCTFFGKLPEKVKIYCENVTFETKSVVQTCNVAWWVRPVTCTYYHYGTAVNVKLVKKCVALKCQLSSDYLRDCPKKNMGKAKYEKKLHAKKTFHANFY